MRFIDLQEGPNDPGIFKAIFLAGGPGSGKSYVASQLGLISRGLRVVNSDDAFEYLMRKRKLSFEMPPEEQPERDLARQRAKELTGKKQDTYLDGRLGLIIDGTAKDVTKMANLKTELEAIGYQTMMVFVNTNLKTALARNLQRDRKVPAEIVVKSHKQVQDNKESLANVFAPNFVEIFNDDNPNFNTPLKRVDKFLEAPLTPAARDWVSKAQLQKSVAQEDISNNTKVIYRLDKEAPMDNTEVAVLGGAGRYTLAGLRKKARKEAEALAKDLEVEHGGAFRKSAYNVKQLANTLDTVVAAYDELNSIRKGGGSRSKGIRNEDVQGKPKVYVDMDGVLANFYAGVTAATGHAEPRELALQDIEDAMASFAGTDFFYTLPKYEQADQLIALVNKMSGGDWYILSSPLKYDREGSAKHKAAWVKKYLNIQPKGMHFTGDKAQFATQPDGTPNILIDDYPKYLEKWTNAGGIGVKYKGHVGNIEDVKATLDKYLDTGVKEENKPRTAKALIYQTDMYGAKGYYGQCKEPGCDYKTRTYDRAAQAQNAIKKHHQDHFKDVEETIRKVKGGYRLVSKKGKNLGTYPSKAGAEKRERQVQHFKHMGEQGRSTADEPDPKGYQHSLLTAPQNTLVVDKSDDMDFYKLGQHYTSLANYDPHELGVGPSDMTITFASPEEMERMKAVFDKLGVKYKDISGSHEEPEIHTKETKKPGRLFSALSEIADSPYDYVQNVKTPDKRAYRFQTDAGQLYRVQVFNRRKDDANKLEIHFDLTDMKTGKPETGVTGTGDAVRVFSTVANILQKEVASQDPTGVIIASKADDESRVKLYRTLARRATKLMPDYEVAGEKSVTGADGNPYLTIELSKK